MTPADVVDRAARLRAALGEGVLDDLLAIAKDRVVSQWITTAADDVAGREALHAQMRALDTIKTTFTAALADGSRALAVVEAKKRPPL